MSGLHANARRSPFPPFCVINNNLNLMKWHLRNSPYFIWRAMVLNAKQRQRRQSQSLLIWFTRTTERWAGTLTLQRQNPAFLRAQSAASREGGRGAAPRTSEEAQVTDPGPARTASALPPRCVNAPLTPTSFPQESVQRNRPDAQVRLEEAEKKKKSPSSHIQSSVGNTGCGSCAYLYQATPSTCRWSYNCIKKPIFKSQTIDRKTKNQSRAFLLSCIKHLWVLARNSFCDSSTGTVREALHCVFDGDDADEETEGRRETDSRRKRFGGGGFQTLHLIKPRKSLSLFPNKVGPWKKCFLLS